MKAKEFLKDRKLDKGRLTSLQRQLYTEAQDLEI